MSRRYKLFGHKKKAAESQNELKLLPAPKAESQEPKSRIQYTLYRMHNVFKFDASRDEVIAALKGDAKQEYFATYTNLDTFEHGVVDIKKEVVK